VVVLYLERGTPALCVVFLCVVSRCSVRSWSRKKFKQYNGKTTRFLLVQFEFQDFVRTCELTNITHNGKLKGVENERGSPL